MKLVIPVSDVDIEKAKLLAQRIVALGGMEAEHVIVISTMRAAWDVEPMLATLRPGFRTTTLHVLPDEDETGWPESANHLFYNGMLFLVESHNDEEPYYWFEADNFPLLTGWWQMFQDEYAAVGKPYMGCVNVSRYYDRETGKEIEDGQHMVGTGIYPARFAFLNDRVHHLIRHPWDVYLGPEVVPQCHHTNLIAHRWGTCNYRMEADQLVCDNTDHAWHKYAAPVPSAAAVVHGSKDLSLYKLFDSP